MSQPRNGEETERGGKTSKQPQDAEQFVEVPNIRSKETARAEKTTKQIVLEGMANPIEAKVDRRQGLCGRVSAIPRCGHAPVDGIVVSGPQVGGKSLEAQRVITNEIARVGRTVEVPQGVERIGEVTRAVSEELEETEVPGEGGEYLEELGGFEAFCTRGWLEDGSQ